MVQGRLYTVTELAKQLEMTARAIRFYEDKGLITPQRAGTTRVYSARDRARMILILRGKRLGFSLSAIKEYLDLYDTDITQHAQLRVLLAGVAKRRGQLLAQRQAIDEALSELDDITAQTEAALKIPAPRTRRAASG
jgi:DNA-binding transcriptional MerR regulator